MSDKKQLTKRQKLIEASRIIKNLIKNDIEPNLLYDLEESIKGDEKPDKWYLANDESFINEIINNNFKK